MPTYRVTDPETQQTLRLTGDSPPTEQELEEIFASQSQRTRTQRTESRIAQRESLVPKAAAATAGSFLSRFSPRTAATNVLNPLSAIGREVQEGALRLGAMQEQIESLTASPLVSAQAGRPIGHDLISVLKGERVVERGDIARNLGAPEGVAAMFGLAASPEAALPALAGTRAGLRAMLGAKKFLALGRPSTIGTLNIPREQLVRRVQQRLLSAPKLAGREFEQGLNEAVAAHPEQRVDLSASLGSYLEKAKNNPAFKTLIQRQALNHQESVFVKSLLDQPEMAANLTLKASQLVKQIFQRVNKQKFTQIDPDFFGAHLDALDVWHGIRSAQLSAFPEFKTVVRGYAKALQDFRVIKNALKEGAVEGNLLKHLGGDSQRIKAFRELATPETIQMVERLQKTTATRNFLRRLGVIGAGVAATKAIGKPALGFLGLREAAQ